MTGRRRSVVWPTHGVLTTTARSCPASSGRDSETQEGSSRPVAHDAASESLLPSGPPFVRTNCSSFDIFFGGRKRLGFFLSLPTGPWQDTDRTPHAKSAGYKRGRLPLRLAYAARLSSTGTVLRSRSRWPSHWSFARICRVRQCHSM